MTVLLWDGRMKVVLGFYQLEDRGGLHVFGTVLACPGVSMTWLSAAFASSV